MAKTVSTLSYLVMFCDPGKNYLVASQENQLAPGFFATAHKKKDSP
jgi:hypothetical protein